MATPDKEIAKLLIPQRYDGSTTQGAKLFIAQCKEYFGYYGSMIGSLRLQILVALNLLDKDAKEWATQYIVLYVEGSDAPFTDLEAFYKVLLTRFGHVDDAAAAQVEIEELVKKDKREKRTVAELSAAFAGPAKRSGYGKPELLNKYRDGLPTRVFRKIQLEKFSDWNALDTRALEVKQLLNLDKARRPEVPFFQRSKASRSQTAASITINAAVGDGKFPGNCYGCGQKGYRRMECPNCKDKPRQQRVRATVAAMAATSAPAESKSKDLDVSALLAEMTALKTELKELRSLKESEGF